MRCAAAGWLALLSAGCALQGPAGSDTVAPPPHAWHPVALPGKASTHYTPAHKDGRAAIAAVSVRSASMWRRQMSVPTGDLGDVSFSWWVPHLMPDASVADVEREDASARVLFAFGGDLGRLTARNRMLFDLAEALTGEKPPFATLMYVWDASAPVGSVIVNPRSDRIRKIVVDSGPQQLGRWREHRRDLTADFRRAFGEAPGTLRSVAMMTDSDNTRSSAQAWYGPVRVHCARSADCE
ncbi:MAG: DUF3047 domain-containing protein [Chitinophagaceae bacterium]|nr:DUF3047 domain-containing protein [Rubrivivax sp.]